MAAKAEYKRVNYTKAELLAKRSAALSLYLDGKTQEEIAEALDIERRHVSNWTKQYDWKGLLEEQERERQKRIVEKKLYDDIASPTALLKHAEKIRKAVKDRSFDTREAAENVALRHIQTAIGRPDVVVNNNFTLTDLIKQTAANNPKEGE